MRRFVKETPYWVLQRMVTKLANLSKEIICVVPGVEGNCWVCVTALDSGWLTTYSHVKAYGHRRPAHWAAYEEMFGYVEDPDLNLDHLCHTAPCWNPWHLEPVTHAVNNARRVNPELLDRCRRPEARRLV